MDANAQWQSLGGIVMGVRAVSLCRGQERGRDDRPHSVLGQLHIVLDQRTFLGFSVDGTDVFILGQKVNMTGLGERDNDISGRGWSAACSR